MACVESIRAAKSANGGESEAATSGSSGTSGGGEAAADTPACLPVAVAAWTKCCEEANLREGGHQEKVAAAS